MRTIYFLVFLGMGLTIKAQEGAETQAQTARYTEEPVIYFFPVAVSSAVKATSGFGTRIHPKEGKWKHHSGIDIGAALQTPVYAAGDGIVKDCGYRSTLGYFVTILHRNNYTTTYGHLSSYSVLPGMVIIGGTQIAKVGTTGASTGPHLHFTLKRFDQSINPEAFLVEALLLHNVK